MQLMVLCTVYVSPMGESSKTIWVEGLVQLPILQYCMLIFKLSNINENIKMSFKE